MLGSRKSGSCAVGRSVLSGFAAGTFKPSIESPAIGGTDLSTVFGASSMTTGRNGAEAFAVRTGEAGGTADGNADRGSSAGAPTGRRGSSEVPHIPQKRKLGALSSLQFGQITIVPPISFPTV